MLTPENATLASFKFTSKKNSHREGESRKRDRFGGCSEQEILSKTLPDILSHSMDILIVGYNPGLMAAYIGHHYAGPGNHFWKCLEQGGLTRELMHATQDTSLLLNYNIGLTNIVSRTTRGSSDLSRSELKEGLTLLSHRVNHYKPLIVAFNGKGIYEVVHGNKNFPLGRQAHKLHGTNAEVFVMPSSSARCSQLPRASDKTPYYTALRLLRDLLKGDVSVKEHQLVFPLTPLKMKKKEEVVVAKEELKDEVDGGKEERRGVVAKGVKRKMKGETVMATWPSRAGVLGGGVAGGGVADGFGVVASSVGVQPKLESANHAISHFFQPFHYHPISPHHIKSTYFPPPSHPHLPQPSHLPPNLLSSSNPPPPSQPPSHSTSRMFKYFGGMDNCSEESDWSNSNIGQNYKQRYESNDMKINKSELDMDHGNNENTTNLIIPNNNNFNTSVADISYVKTEVKLEREQCDGDYCNSALPPHNARNNNNVINSILAHKTGMGDESAPGQLPVLSSKYF